MIISVDDVESFGFTYINKNIHNILWEHVIEFEINLINKNIQNHF
jgi:hypothetical protein